MSDMENTIQPVPVEFPIRLTNHEGESLLTIFIDHEKNYRWYHVDLGYSSDFYSRRDFTDCLKALLSQIHNDRAELKREVEKYRALQKALSASLGLDKR